jgi:SSS family solute:Na+ symporter
MALSYGATFISASAIVGFGGVAATFGMGIQWLCLLNMFTGVVIAFIFFGKRTRRLGARYNARTFPQFLGLHYGSRTIQVFVAAVVFVGMPLYAAVVMKGGAVFIERMFHMDFNVALLIFTLIVAAYVITGGITGVLYTAALQAVIMFTCMIFLLFRFYHALDMGFTEANRALTDLSPLVPEPFRALGHRGWTQMPAAGSPQWYTLVTSLILGVGIGCLAQPQLVVRFMMVDSAKQLNRGVLIGCLFLIITVGAIYHVGALSNLFFYKTQGVVASEAVGDMDKIIPLLIDRAMPPWFGTFFMLCILSASMSTLSAQFHTMGSAFGADVFPRLGRSRDAHSTLSVRIGVLISILLSYVICYTLSANIIARGTALFMGVCAATFLPAYFCALYWKRVTRRGAHASLWVGLCVSLFVMLFLHRAEAQSVGLCRLLTGRDTLIKLFPWYAVDPILFALPLSTLTIVLVSLFKTDKPSPQI